jgi:signal transduction histidine kinase
MLVVRVRDDGPGVSEAARGKLFEPNFSTKKEGMGLGLAIVEGIVRGHGGTIEVASRVSEETVFTIRLPAGEEVAAGAPDPPPAAAEEER